MFISLYELIHGGAVLCIALLIGAFLGACRKGSGAEQMEDLIKDLSSRDSANHYLVIGELDKFRYGRLKTETLDDVQWRGHFVMASRHEDKSVAGIIYEVLPGGPKTTGGVWIWAIFADNRFKKFVKWQGLQPEDKEFVTPTYSRPKPLKAGDDRFLIRAVNAEAVTAEDLIEEVHSIGPPPPVHADPGLTAAYLLMRALGIAAGRENPPTAKDYERNATLRDQFNPARLDIGMTEAEIEAVLKAKPLESGQIEGGSYRIYGSNETFDIGDWLRFSNVLVIFREGKAIRISSIDSGYDWRQRLAERIIDLPVPE